MPRGLKDFPRPPNDNGRGLHGSASTGWSGGHEGYDYWIGELVAMGIKWFKVLDDGGDSLPLCERLLAEGIFPIVRIIRKDPPPNDLPEPNPGHIGKPEEQTIQRLIAAGVRYFETNNEPNLGAEWKHNAMPSDPIEAAKLVALNWLFDARLILEAGGLPGVPAISIGGDLDLLGALVSLGRQEILLEGCWIAVHNYSLNHPLGYPDDLVNRTGQPLSEEQYDHGALTPWVWWNHELGCVDPIDRVNEERAARKNPAQTILQDHSCFREFEYYNYLVMKYVGASIPILSTEGGLLVGRREDLRYPRVTPETHRDQTIAMFDFMQRQAPDYYFAATPWLLLGSAGWEADAWNSSFWQRAFKQGTDGRNGIPPIAVPGLNQGDRLQVIDGVKAMPNLARRLPGAQPAPPVQPPVQVSAHPQPQPPIVINPPAPPRPVKMPSLREYTVAPGDTLVRIAQQFGTTWKAIASLNHLATPNLIRPGQVLRIPSPVSAATSYPRDEPLEESETAQPEPSYADDERELLEEALPKFTPTEEEDKVARPQSQWAATYPSVPAPPAPPPTPQAKPTQTGPAEIPPALGANPAFVFSDIPKPELDWDLRLDALNITLEEAPVNPGTLYWKLIRAEYKSPVEADGNHEIQYIVLDEHGEPLAYRRVWQGWSDDKTDATTNHEGMTHIPVWGSYAPDRGESGPYLAWVDGLPSDRVCGIGLPFKHQVSFVLTWQQVVA